MKKETFIKRFGKDHPALINGFTWGVFFAKNRKMYTLFKTKNGIVAKLTK